MAILTGCKPEDLINLSQAARELGVSRMTIYNMLGRGELYIAETIAGLPYVDRRVVEELKRRRSGPERSEGAAEW